MAGQWPLGDEVARNPKDPRGGILMEKRFVSITGAHGVGKTTLIHATLSQLLKQHEASMIAEPAREIAKSGFYVNDRISADGIFEYLRFCLSEARQSQASLILTDRSILDLYAYTRELFPSKFSSSLEGLIREQINVEKIRTKLYVYVPIEFPMQVDDLRPADLDYQAHIDSVVKELLTEFEMPVLRVTGTIEQRVDQVLRATTEHLAQSW